MPDGPRLRAAPDLGAEAVEAHDGAARVGADHALALRIRDRVLRECDVVELAAAGDDAAAAVRVLARELLADERVVLAGSRVEAIVDQVVAATTGYGPLHALLADPDVGEVMVNGPRDVFVERGGELERVAVEFEDDEHLLQVIDRMIAPIGRRLDALNPMVDARLPDGSRVNAIIPPLALEGPVLTIRRFLSTARSLDDLVGFGSITPAQADELRDLVDTRANVLVSGGTSSGKTTLLASLLALCEPRDRIIVIEDAAELPLEHPHRVRLEARPATWGEAGVVRVRDLVRNALRMRPDRIVVGEVRGEEAFDLVQALNTGHRGCWSTVHANSPEDALLRVESMALLAGSGVPQSVLRVQVARALDAVVHVARAPDGRRHVASIARVEPAGDGWVVHDPARVE